MVGRFLAGWWVGAENVEVDVKGRFEGEAGRGAQSCQKRNLGREEVGAEREKVVGQ
jgi:hypothetical protein